MKTYTIPAIAITVAALIWTLFPATESPSCEQSTIPPRLQTVASKPTEILPRQSYTWRVGDTASFSIKTGVCFGPDQTDNNSGIKIIAKMHLRVESAAEDTVVLAAKISEAIVEQEQALQPLMADVLLQNTGRIELGTDGSLKSILFPPDCPTEDRDLLRMCLGWEFVIKPSGSWQTRETIPNANNYFMTSYKRKLSEIHKERSFILEEKSISQQRVLSSKFVGQPGDLWLESLEGEETSQLIFEEQPMLRSTVWVKLQQLASEAIVHWEMGPHTNTPSKLTREPHSKILERLQLAENYRHVALNTLSDQVRSLSGKSTAEKLPAMKVVTDWLKVHGIDGVKQLLEELKQHPDQDTSGMLLHALAEAGLEGGMGLILENFQVLTPEALLQAIVAAGSGNAEDMRLVNALRTLTFAEISPSPDGDDYRPNDAAWYALGRLASESPTLNAQLESALLPQLQNPETDAAMRVVALRTLANAESTNPLTFSLSQQSLETAGTESTLTIAALELLGQAQQTIAKDRVTALLENHSASEVQMATLAYLQQTGSDSYIPQIEALTKSPEPSVAQLAQILAAKTGGLLTPK